MCALAVEPRAICPVAEAKADIATHNDGTPLLELQRNRARPGHNRQRKWQTGCG
jgi:hypothetical protein